MKEFENFVCKLYNQESVPTDTERIIWEIKKPREYASD